MDSDRLNRWLTLGANIGVLAGIGLLGHSRGQVTGLADGALNILSYAAIGLIGRMHGSGWYTRTQDMFQMERPVWSDDT